jgi:arsenate reductase
MAEGWARKLLPAEIAVYSAGSSPTRNVHPMAVCVMQEVSVDISGQQTKRITDVPLGKVDMVVTLCSEEVCVNLPGSIQRKTWLLSDPASVSDPTLQKEQFQKTRDLIREHVLALKTEFTKASENQSL